MDPELLARLNVIDARLSEVVELSRQTLERVEYTEERIARASSELIHIGALAGRPVYLERAEDGGTTLLIGQVRIQIENNAYVRLRALAFKKERFR